MKIKVELLSDAVFGSGVSVPGGEDISIIYDKYGFPYFKGSAFRGVFREEFINYYSWTGLDNKAIKAKINKLFGEGGYEDNKDVLVDDQFEGVDNARLIFTDLSLDENVRNIILSTENITKDEVLDSLTYTRMFTSIDESDISKNGSLRSCRCIKKGLVFYGDIFGVTDEEEVTNILKSIKWIGSMRTRGFGRVKISKLGGEK